MFKNIVASRRARAGMIRKPSQEPVSWSVPEADALDLAVELTLHYRTCHLVSRERGTRIEICRCRRFDPAGELYVSRLHAEIYSALRKGGLPDLLEILETASGRPGLLARREDMGIAVA